MAEQSVAFELTLVGDGPMRDEIEAKIRLYEAYHNNVDRWIALDGGRAENWITVGASVLGAMPLLFFYRAFRNAKQAPASDPEVWLLLVAVVVCSPM